MNTNHTLTTNVSAYLYEDADKRKRLRDICQMLGKHTGMFQPITSAFCTVIVQGNLHQLLQTINALQAENFID